MILNRYLLSQFLKVFFFVAILFALIIQIGHLFDRLQVFVNNHVPVGVIALYLVCMVPLWLIQALPFCTLIAGVTTIGNLAKSGELFCLRSSGISTRRILMPLFAMASLLTILTFVLGNTVMPQATSRARTIYRQYIDKEGAQTLIWKDIVVLAKNQKRISAKILDIKKGTMKTVTVEEYGENLNLRQTLTAKEAQWDAQSGWIFYDGVIRLFSKESNEIIEEESFVSAQLQLSEKPTDLAPLQVAPEEMNLTQLRQYIKKLNNLGISALRETVQYYLKFAFPFTHLLVLAIGVPIAFRTTPSGGGQGRKGFSNMKSLSVALAIGFVYYALITLGLSMGESRKLHPILAVWLGNAVFAIIGFFMLRRID